MSNYALKAEVGRLKSELSQVERENNQLKSEISSAVHSVNQAESALSQYNQHIRNELDRAAGTIGSSISRALDAYELQGQIDQLYSRYKCVELANKKIRALNNKKYYEFNQYRTVRKIVQGMMDNLDLTMVSDEVIYKSIEKQHLLTPDFWLTSALISIMAWKNDDKLLADKALESAVKLDKKNSSIFYMIFNLRMGREEAAVKWFLEYQKCQLKGSDESTFLMLFSLISKTISDKVDEETSGMIMEFIHRLVLENARKEGYGEEDVIDMVRQRMLGLMKNGSYDLPLLAKYCTDYSHIVKVLNMAGNNYNILEFILKIVIVPITEKNTYLKEYLNELLEKPNSMELETYKEIEYNERIIRMGGDVEGAKLASEQELLKEDSELNIVSSIIGWIYDLGNEEVNGQMRLNMFTLVKTFQEKAAEACFSLYRSLDKAVHPVQILDYTEEMNFQEKAGEVSKAEQFYQEQQKQELSKVKNLPAYILFGAGALCGGAAFYVHLFFLAGLFIGLCGGAGILISNHVKKKNMILSIQSQKNIVLEIMNQLFAEYEKMKEIYKEYDAVAVKIKEEFAKL